MKSILMLIWTGRILVVFYIDGIRLRNRLREKECCIKCRVRSRLIRGGRGDEKDDLDVLDCLVLYSPLHLLLFPSSFDYLKPQAFGEENGVSEDIRNYTAG